MKKSYGKPFVCCENFTTGEVLTNSVEYAEQVRKKMKKCKDVDVVVDDSNCDDKKE